MACILNLPPVPPAAYISFVCAQHMQPECTAATQIAKMTPFRSFCVMSVTALTLTIMALLQLKGGTITYVIVSLLFCMTADLVVFCCL